MAKEPKAPKGLNEGQKKRLEKALATVGVTGDMFPELVLATAETAAAKFATTTMDRDKDLYRAEVVRLAASLLA